MSVLETLVSIIAPHTCIGCATERDRLLCEGCLETLPRIPSRCYRCKAVTDDYATCKSCRSRTPLASVYAYAPYQDTAKELIHRMKYERARQGAKEIAQALNTLLPTDEPDTIISFIPTATGRVRSRGYDHAALIARAFGRGRTYQTTLARLGQDHQVGARRAERMRQLATAFRPVRPELYAGKTVLLIDDVLTTGATLESAARVLKRNGAKRVEAIVFAQA